MSKKIKIVVGSMILMTIIGSQIVYAADEMNNSINQNQTGGKILEAQEQNMPNGNIGGNNGRYSHGSETIVSEPNNTVEEGYQINQDTQAKAKDGVYSKLFDTENIQEVNIEISDDNWNYMLQNAINTPTVLANSFSIGDEKIENVGIKTKGNLTLSSLWNSDSDRFSFTINTKKFIKKSDYGENQNFYGLTKIALNNVYGDASYIKEYLSYKLMNEMGIPSSYCSLVKVNVNGEYWGLYTMVESMDESLIKRTLGSSDGALYKCESPGGSLLYDSNLDSLYNSETGKFNFDLSTYSDKSNVLSNYTGILDNKCYGNTVEEYSEYSEKDKEEVSSDVNELFLWMKKLNELNSSENPNTNEYKEQVESIMDVDEILRYFAVNTYLDNLDSYQSEKMQNYALYIQDGKATVLPWDYNFSFGGYGVQDSSSMVNFSIDNPVSNTTLKERPLLNVLLQNDEYKALYKKYLNNCSEIVSTGGIVDGITYEASNYSNEISRYKTMLSDLVGTDPTAFYSQEKFNAAIDALSLLINLRSTAVSNQVNGDDTPVDSSSVNLRDIGDAIGGGGQGGPGMPPDGDFNPGGQRPEGGFDPNGTGTPQIPPNNGGGEAGGTGNDQDLEQGTNTPLDKPATSTNDENDSSTSDTRSIFGILGAFIFASISVFKIKKNK